MRSSVWNWCVLGVMSVAGFWSAPRVEEAHAAARTWEGGSGNWFDGAGNGNWSSDDEPDSDDEAIFNTPNSVHMGSNNTIQALSLSNGIDLFTNDRDLAVDGLVQLMAASTNLFVGGSASELNADTVTINSGSTVELTEGTLVLDQETGNGILTINMSGTLAGHGTVSFADAPNAVTTLLINSGTLSALSQTAQVGTLTIGGGGTLARIDLDGVGGLAVVNVNRNQTLDINMALADDFNGLINLFQNSKLDIATPWTLAGGTIFVGAGGGPFGLSTIAGGTLTQTGGGISVNAAATLQIDAQFIMNSSSLTNFGTVVFNAAATLGAAANFAMPGSSSSITVKSNRSVSINQNTFDLDGGEALTNVITVESGGFLDVNTFDYDSNISGVNGFEGTMTLNSGHIEVNSGAAFVMNGTLNLNGTSDGQLPTWTGDTLQIGNVTATLDAHVNVSGTVSSRIDAPVSFQSRSAVSISAGAELLLNNSAVFGTFIKLPSDPDYVASFSGPGKLTFSSQVNVNEAVTLNMAGGTVSLDGVDTVGDPVAIDAPLVINAATLDPFGKANTSGTNIMVVNSLTAGHSGALTVNLDGPGGSWTVNSQAILNLYNDNTLSTLLSGDDAVINGRLNIIGNVQTDARVVLGALTSILTAGQSLRLNGGDNGVMPNSIAGGTINGPGNLAANSDKGLRGFGTINANIDFDGTAVLEAHGGMLTINGNILDVDAIGTVDDTGILYVVNAWNSDVANAVRLGGGELKGGTLTIGNASGVYGRGLVSSRVVNNTRIQATGTGTLVVETIANDNDWDGDGNTGTLSADMGGTLELRDNGPVAFGGTVSASDGGTVFVKGFDLSFLAGSAISLTASTLKSTNSININGSVSTLAGAASTIEVEDNMPLNFNATSTTTLNANLQLKNNNIQFAAGASFSGSGVLTIAEDSVAVTEPSATIDASLENRGELRPSGISTVGQLDLKDFQQSSAGELILDVNGTSPTQFDRLSMYGSAILNGTLDIQIGGAYIPALNDLFTIVSAAGGVTGAFSSVVQPTTGLPDGLFFKAIYSPTLVQLTVVNEGPGDFNVNGVVDAADYVAWRKTGINGPTGYDTWRTNFGEPGGSLESPAQMPPSPNRQR